MPEHPTAAITRLRFREWSKGLAPLTSCLPPAALFAATANLHQCLSTTQRTRRTLSGSASRVPAPTARVDTTARAALAHDGQESSEIPLRRRCFVSLANRLVHAGTAAKIPPRLRSGWSLAVPQSLPRPARFAVPARPAKIRHRAGSAPADSVSAASFSGFVATAGGALSARRCASAAKSNSCRKSCNASCNSLTDE